MRLYLFIFAAIFLSSCPPSYYEEKRVGPTYHFYDKCFYLGETSFIIEGETYKNILKVYYSGEGNIDNNYAVPPLTENIPFDHLVARISQYNPNILDYYTEWEIPAIQLSDSTFRLQVDITANGITIDKNTVTDSVFKGLLYLPPYTGSSGIRGSYPAFELKFYFNNRLYDLPVFQEIENNKYRLFYYTYIYVAEPIYRSGSNTHTYSDPYHMEEYHYDYNFSKPGWYKIIYDYNREINDDPKFSTGENTYFLLP